MIINVFLNYRITFEDLIENIRVENYQILNNRTLWCEGYYIKYSNGILEANIYDPTISAKFILYNVLEWFVAKRAGLFIQIKEGRRSIQFISENDDYLCMSIS